MRENCCDDKKLKEIIEQCVKEATNPKPIPAGYPKKTETGNITTYTSTNNCTNYTVGGWFKLPTEKEFIPVKVIYNCPATICYFPDGTKEVVKVAEDEEYVKEYGVMACIIKKIFKSRNQFKKLVRAGYENTDAIYERNAHNAMLRRRNE